MPRDTRLWSEATISSSYPACMGVKAAAEQGDEAAGRSRARRASCGSPPNDGNQDGLYVVRFAGDLLVCEAQCGEPGRRVRLITAPVLRLLGGRPVVAQARA
jgi:hypothetical protein